jgi:hypothetical protein
MEPSGRVGLADRRAPSEVDRIDLWLGREDDEPDMDVRRMAGETAGPEVLGKRIDQTKPSAHSTPPFPVTVDVSDRHTHPLYARLRSATRSSVSSCTSKVRDALGRAAGASPTRTRSPTFIGICIELGLAACSLRVLQPM